VSYVCLEREGVRGWGTCKGVHNLIHGFSGKATVVCVFGAGADTDGQAAQVGQEHIALAHAPQASKAVDIVHPDIDAFKSGEAHQGAQEFPQVCHL
jgi:hypothetical protein